MKIKVTDTTVYYVTLNEEDTAKLKQYAEENDCELEAAYDQLVYGEEELGYPDDVADDVDCSFNVEIIEE